MLFEYLVILYLFLLPFALASISSSSSSSEESESGSNSSEDENINVPVVTIGYPLINSFFSSSSGFRIMNNWIWYVSSPAFPASSPIFFDHELELANEVRVSKLLNEIVLASEPLTEFSFHKSKILAEYGHDDTLALTVTWCEPIDAETLKFIFSSIDSEIDFITKLISISLINLGNGSFELSILTNFGKSSGIGPVLMELLSANKKFSSLKSLRVRELLKLRNARITKTISESFIVKVHQKADEYTKFARISQILILFVKKSANDLKTANEHLKRAGKCLKRAADDYSFAMRKYLYSLKILKWFLKRHNIYRKIILTPKGYFTIPDDSYTTTQKLYPQNVDDAVLIYSNDFYRAQDVLTKKEKAIERAKLEVEEAEEARRIIIEAKALFSS